MATKPMVFLKNIDFSYLWLVILASTHCGQVKTLKEHQLLVEKAKAKNVLLQIEVENLDIFEHQQWIISNIVLAYFQFYISTIDLLLILPQWPLCLSSQWSLYFDCFTFFPGAQEVRSDLQWREDENSETWSDFAPKCLLHQVHYHSHRHHNCFRHYSFDSTSNRSCQRLSQPVNATF